MLDEKKLRQLINNGASNDTIGAVVADMLWSKIDEGLDFESIIKSFNATCTSLPKIGKLTPKRKSALKSRIKESSIEEVKEVFFLVEKSDFLSGRSTSWKANFDWVLNPNNFLKIIEGNYANNKDKSAGINGGKDSASVQRTARKQFDTFGGADSDVQDGRRDDFFSIDQYQ
jgi:hypothetical protein